MTPTIHQGQVLKKFMEDHRLKVAEVAKAIGVDRTYFYALYEKPRITEKPLKALKENLNFDPDTYAPNLTTKGQPIRLNRVKVPGLVLRDAMKSAGISQDDAADALGVSRSTIVRYWQKAELDYHVVDQVKEKMGLDLEVPAAAPVSLPDTENVPDEAADALMRFSTKLYEEFQVIQTLSKLVNFHDKDIDSLKQNVDRNGKRIDGVNAEVRDIIRRHDDLQKQHNDLQRRFNNFKK